MDNKFRKIPSLDFRYEVSRDGIVRNIKSKKIKKQQITIHGYYRTNYRVNKTNPHYNAGQGWDRCVHSLVMECWGPKRPSPNHIIDHIDRNKLNNCIDNLRWVTYSENAYNSDVETRGKKISKTLLSSPNIKRVPVRIVNNKTHETLEFNSRYQCALWLIENNKTTTQNPCALSRRISTQKHVCGYDICNINAERLA